MKSFATRPLRRRLSTHSVAHCLLAVALVSTAGCGDVEGAGRTPSGEVTATDPGMAAPPLTAPEMNGNDTPVVPVIPESSGGPPPAILIDPGPVPSSAPSTGPSEEVPRYLLHITEDDQLRHISIDDASVSQVCNLQFVGRPNSSFCSLTFNREDRLFASTGGDSELWEIELPSCRASIVGVYGHQSVCGITPAPSGNRLFGVSIGSNALLAIDENTGASVEVGPLGSDFGPLGATWVDRDSTVRAISGIQDSLFTLDAVNGHAMLDFELDVNFSTVGMEYHPQTRKIYACTGAASDLFEIALEDGVSSVVGDTNISGCTNLGAPFAEPILPPLVSIR